MATQEVTHRSYRVISEINVHATTRDGTVLQADVYLPDFPGRFPTILERTPYNKSGERFKEKGRELVELRYLAIFQDVRKLRRYPVDATGC